MFSFPIITVHKLPKVTQLHQAIVELNSRAMYADEYQHLYIQQRIDQLTTELASLTGSAESTPSLRSGVGR